MSEDRFKGNKVLTIEDWLKARQEGEDGLSQLLNHMRNVREAVPVNRRLQVELRKKLMERQKELLQQGFGQSKPSKPAKDVKKIAAACRHWLIPAVSVAVVLMLVFALGSMWRHANGKLFLEASGAPQEISRFWTESQPLQPAISPDGSQILVVRGGGLVLLSETGVQLASLEPPEGGYFRSPGWSPDGKQIAFVQGSSGVSEEIKQMPASELSSPAKTKLLNSTQNYGAAVETEAKMDMELQDNQMAKTTELVDTQKESGAYCSNLIYSPDGKKIAYVSKTAGQISSVWLLMPDGKNKFVTEGDNPTWSPDGKSMVVQRPQVKAGYNLWLVDVENGKSQLLGQGERPTWGNNGYLAFVNEKAQERILTFLPDGEPQYSVRQQVPEIRVVYLGKDGTPVLERLNAGDVWLATSTLLVAQENRVSGMEINWLRQQELSGNRGPKTLVLDEINKCEGQVFGPDGKWLLFARRDGDTVALVKLRLEERWEKRRD